ncbi:hypothetical protein CYMTET_51497 [Cymbomonas tetramitiformis]|uniref:Uncharacterized protein n=1 Tax=Cymbomonas tetramitiformis TaxID=36881 RepID=A0AAE0BMT4_9CHLO|nr:hypothetical protein CYMTET_51497 [Cymbomonas tetramitiformis]
MARNALPFTLLICLEFLSLSLNIRVDTTKEYQLCNSNPRGCTKLIVGRANLTGSIPTELGRFTALEELSIDEASLTGPIPTELGHLTSLRSISFKDQSLTGTVPTELVLLTSVENLDVSRNSGLCGPLPRQLVESQKFKFEGTGLGESCSLVYTTSPLTSPSALSPPPPPSCPPASPAPRAPPPSGPPPAPPKLHKKWSTTEICLLAGGFGIFLVFGVAYVCNHVRNRVLRKSSSHRSYLAVMQGDGATPLLQERRTDSDS